MGFKRGLLIGFGAGYVLGTRAGRERYEQIVDTWNRLAGSPRVQQATGRTKDVVQRGVEKAGSAVRQRLRREGGGATDVTMGDMGEVEPAPDLAADYVEPISDVTIREEVELVGESPGVEEPVANRMLIEDLEEQASEPDAQLPPEEYRREGETSL